MDIPQPLLIQILVAGFLLLIMSVIDTLSYGVRTAGVFTKRLAISLSLFNALVIFSRLSNMIQQPVLGNLPDKVDAGIYNYDQVLMGLRIDLIFVLVGCVIGALLTPTFIRTTRRGIEVMDQRGSLPPTVLHGIRNFRNLRYYSRAFHFSQIKNNLKLGDIPRGFLIFNILVTSFYAVGVMSTLLAASIDHDLAGTAIGLSGIVNGMATFLLFIIVDPPAAVIIDQCINGKRPIQQAKILNLYLIITRIMGICLGWIMLPWLGQYVLTVARWVDGLF